MAMRYILVAGIALAAGCQNVIGPFQARSPTRVDDPRLTIEEQERLTRDRYALPDDAYAAGPRDATVRPGQALQGRNPR